MESFAISAEAPLPAPGAVLGQAHGTFVELYFNPRHGLPTCHTRHVQEARSRTSRNSATA
eukprot:3326509-Alexandrium_andersonii.AAC.1